MTLPSSLLYYFIRRLWCLWIQLTSVNNPLVVKLRNEFGSNQNHFLTTLLHFPEDHEGFDMYNELCLLGGQLEPQGDTVFGVLAVVVILGTLGGLVWIAIRAWNVMMICPGCGNRDRYKTIRDQKHKGDVPPIILIKDHDDDDDLFWCSKCGTAW